MKRNLCNLDSVLPLSDKNPQRMVGARRKSPAILTVSVAFSFLIVSSLLGCGREQNEAANLPAEEIEVPQHSAQKGLLLPEVTRKSLDLKTVEVTEQKVSATFEFQVRVFQASATNALASGMVTAEEAKGLKPGQMVSIKMEDGEAHLAHSGSILAVKNFLEKSSGIVEVLVQMPTQAGALKTGEFLNASVTQASDSDVTTVPREALLECSDGPFVYTVNGEAFLRTPVKLGVRNDEVVEIKDGLYAGDQVALRPVMSLWLMELAAIKGGQACCIEPPKGN